MKRALLAVLCLIVSGWVSAQQPTNSWSNEDYDFYAGDFNGDGYTDVLFIAHSPSMPSGILLSDGTAPTILGQTWASNYLGIPWSSDAYTVIVGDFNGDGKTDIFLQANGPGDSYLLLTDSSGHISGITQTIPEMAMGIAWSADQHRLVAGDFGGVGRAGLFFQPTTPGGTSAVVYTDTNGQFTSAAPVQTWEDGYLGFNWSASDANIYAGDFNGDGRADLLIQAQPIQGEDTEANVTFAYPQNMNGVVLSQPGAQPFTLAGVQAWSRTAFGVDWSPLANNLIIGDFNGDGRADVLVQPLATGGLAGLLLGNASGPIFTPAAGPLPTDSSIAADTAVLLAGRFSGGNASGLLLQSVSRDGVNSVATNIQSGVHPKTVSMPSLTSTSLPIAGIGYPSTGATTQATQAAVQVTPMAGTVSPTSAGRTAAQFSVSPMGAATYNIPLWTPPGVHGIEPHLALHYTSGGSDGPLGPGWSITGLSAIVRCGKTWASTGGTTTTLGTPAGVTLTTSDDVCLDGNRLRITSGNPLQSGSTYQTEIADFSLITAKGQTGGGPQYFVVQAKDGRYYEYGNSATSQIFASGTSTPYAWALDKVYDRFGNGMTFTYVSGASLVQLSTINYTYSQGGLGATNALYQVMFNYVQRTGGTTINKYVAGGSVYLSQQLDNVTVTSLQTTTGLVRKYQLGYQASSTTTRPMLQTLQECGGSAGTDCIRPTTISYQSGGTGWSSTATATNLTGVTGGYIPIDVNGDGIPDALYGVASGSNVHWYLKIGSPSGFGSAIDTGLVLPVNGAGSIIIPGRFNGGSGTQFLAPNSGYWYVYTYISSSNSLGSTSTGVPVGNEYLAVDYDGDGLPDLVSASGNTVQVRRNTTVGSTVRFASAATTVYTFPSGYVVSPVGSVNASPVYAADFNADGRADLLVSAAYTVRRSTTYYLEVLMSNGFAAQATNLSFPLSSGAVQPQLGDWNGDGCTDIITSTAIYISNCSGGFTTLTVSGLTVTTQFWAVDWDGDGQTDLVWNNGGTLYLLQSTGSGISSVGSLGISAQNFTAVDQNYDGQLDLAYFDGSGTLHYYPHSGVNTPPDLANSISDGFGINFSPTYIAISQNNYTKLSTAQFPDMDFQGSMYVVNQFSASDGTGGTYTNQFWYYGARFNQQGRGFEGFAEARQYDSRNGVYQYTDYRQDFPNIGGLSEQDTLATNGDYIARTVNLYTSITPGGVSGGTSCTTCYFPYIGTTSQYNFEPTGSKASTSSSGYVSYTTTAYTYDTYGNLTDTKATTTDTDSTTPVSPFNGLSWITEIKNTITNDNSAANWCLGRPTTTTATKTVPSQSSQTRTVGHTIDYVYCRATVETAEPNDSRLKVTTSFSFDNCGNTDSVSVVGLDKNGNSMTQRTTGTSYGARCQLPESVTNALSQTTKTGYRYDLGLPTSTTDPNNIQTAAWTYDDFGRKTQETRADDTYTTYSYTDCVSGSCWGLADLRLLVTSALYSSAQGLLRSEEKFYDGLDRLRYDEGNRVLGAWDVAINTYNNLGLKAYAYLPYSSSSNNGYHGYLYDVANRVSQDTLYDNTGTAYRTIYFGYLGQTTTVKYPDPNGNTGGDTVTKVTDVAGMIRQVSDPVTGGTVAGTTYYTFDPFGNLSQIVDADSYTSTYSYNIRGFKYASNDADAGAWSFTPDSLNELVSQTDANGNVTTFGYDLLGRLTGRTEPESTTPTQWVYGISATSYNIGRIVQVTKPDGYAEAYTYESAGRPLTITYTEDATNYVFTYGYNNQGTVDTVTYPVSTSGYRFVLKNVYDSYGFLNEVKDNTVGTVFWSLVSANDASLPTQETLGNGVQVVTGYTPWTNETISRTEGSGGSQTNLQNLTYAWDVMGNLHQRIDNRQSLTEQFGYDGMNRLLTSTLNGGNNLTLTYDASGNIASKSDVSASAYVYDTAHKHAVKTAGSWSMTYDANGNMITRAGGLISWYSYNLPNTINYTSNSTQFFYNSSHQRWKQVANYAGTVETTHYIGGLLEIMTRGSGPTEYRHQVPAGSSTAVYTRRTDGTTGTYYATSDHLGSSDLVMDSSANVLARESFTPFGARRGSNWTGTPTVADYTAFGNSTRKGFTEHEMLDSVSLVHMNGRVYDPYLGRFLSADTVMQSLGATESINPYAYAWNDPLKYVDPTGHGIGDIIGAIVGIVIAIAAPELISAIATYFTGAGLTLASTALIAGFVGGFVGAFVATGSLSAALTAGLIAGLSAGAFSEIDSAYSASLDDPGSAWSKPDLVLAHAAVGCGSAAASGGNCGKGAIASAVTETAQLEKWIPMHALATWGSMRGTVEEGLLGGAVSAIEGGNFREGFTTGAAEYLVRSLAAPTEAQSPQQKVDGLTVYRMDPSSDGDAYGHYWIEIDVGTQSSYGWWPSTQGISVGQTLFGTDGVLNGQGAYPRGTDVTDPHNGDRSDPELSTTVHAYDVYGDPSASSATYAQSVTNFANSYSGNNGTYSWPFGQNCHSFQNEMLIRQGLTIRPQ
jgi:RHS repeat-associated protein